MKKCIALILALFMFLPGAVAESNPETDVVWYAIIVATQEQSVPVSAYGIDAKLILREDGTCVSENTSQSGSYTIKGTFEWQENTLIVSFPEMADAQYTLDDEGYLRYTGASSVTFYTDNPEEYAQYVPRQVTAPEPVAAETEEAFLGLWTLKTVFFRDAQYTPEEAGIQLALNIGQGHISLFDSISMENQLADYDTEFVQQGLHFLMEEGTDEEHVLSMLYLTEDGEIMTTYLNSHDEPLIQVFMPAEAAE